MKLGVHTYRPVDTTEEQSNVSQSQVQVVMCADGHHRHAWVCSSVG
jgi:hypothetical protein